MKSETKSARELKWFGPNPCELCGKPAKPPNMVISKMKAYHIGCAMDELERLQARFPKLLDAANVRGTYGPWADDWDDKDARYTMSPEDWKLWQEDRAIQADCSNEPKLENWVKR